jgi:phosphatidylserine/phosphatidylglycerophosphate/cardiolipin synthase-like enzyme
MRREKGQLGWLALGRKLFWSWWVWVAVALAAEASSHGNFAAGFATMGFIFYLLAPREHIPRFGLDYKFPIRSDQFLPTVMGVPGVPFIPGNKVTVLTNGDQFYPAMLKAIASAEKMITMEMYIFWAGDIGRQFASALAERRRAGVKVKLLLDAIGSSTIGNEILGYFEEKRLRSRLVQPDLAADDRTLQSSKPPEVDDRRRPCGIHGWRRNSRPVDGERRERFALARRPDSG